SGAFNLPPDHFVQGPLLQLGASGQVAFTVPTTPDGVRRAYVGRARVGHLVDLPPPGAFVGPVPLGVRRRRAFDRSELSPEGLSLRDPTVDPAPGLVRAEPFGAVGRGAPVLNARGDVGFRATFGDARAHYVLPAGASSPVLRVAETAL